MMEFMPSKPAALFSYDTILLDFAFYIVYYPLLFKSHGSVYHTTELKTVALIFKLVHQIHQPATFCIYNTIAIVKVFYGVTHLRVR